MIPIHKQWFHVEIGFWFFYQNLEGDLSILLKPIVMLSIKPPQTQEYDCVKAWKASTVQPSLFLPDRDTKFLFSLQKSWNAPWPPKKKGYSLLIEAVWLVHQERQLQHGTTCSCCWSLEEVFSFLSNTILVILFSYLFFERISSSTLSITYINLQCWAKPNILNPTRHWY